jgi:hypothetical protein
MNESRGVGHAKHLKLLSRHLSAVPLQPRVCSCWRMTLPSWSTLQSFTKPRPDLAHRPLSIDNAFTALAGSDMSDNRLSRYKVSMRHLQQYAINCFGLSNGIF